MHINLPESFSTEADALTFLRSAGVVIGSVATTVAADFMVNCSDELPATPKSWGWTRRPGDQLPNLHRGVLDMSKVKAVQAPSQSKGWTRLDIIQRELAQHQFAGAHAAEWYLRPENLGAFLKVCPKGYLVFLEKYRVGGQSLRVVCLCVREGVVLAGSLYADGDDGWDAGYSFAVCELDAAALNPEPVAP